MSDSLLKFKQCMIKRSIRYIKIILAFFVVTFIGLLILLLLRYGLVDVIGSKLLYGYVVLDCIVMMTLACFVSLINKYRDNVPNLIKRFLLLHIVLPIELCIILIVGICFIGIPILTLFGLCLILEFWGLPVDIIMILSGIGMFIACAINLAACDCLHVNKWADTNMGNVNKWMDLDEFDTL